jgi:hypothetical protein
MQSTQKVYYVLKDFKFILFTIVLLFVPAFLISALAIVFPPLPNHLEESYAQPWGIVTGIFVYTGGEKYSVSGPLFLGTAIVFVIVNLKTGSTERKLRSKLFCLSIFLFAVVANIIWFMAFSSPILQVINGIPTVSFNESFGSSGTIYAAYGTLCSVSLWNSLRYFVALDANTPHKMSGIDAVKKFAIPLVNGFVFLAFFYELTGNYSGFFNIRPDVGYIVHMVAFSLAAVSIFSWFVGRQPDLLFKVFQSRRTRKI